MSEIIPMPSTQIGPSKYEVIGTSRFVVVQKFGACWALVVDGKIDNSRLFDTKREALQHCQEDVTL